MEKSCMGIGVFFAAIISLQVLYGASAARAQQDILEQFTASEIAARADSVSKYQDTLLSQTRYKVREEFIFNELNDKGVIKNSDTNISIVTMDGMKEIDRKVEYSTKKKENKKEHKEEAGVSFSYSDSSYQYSLQNATDSTYIITFSPKGELKKGDYRGTMIVDKQDFTTRKLELEAPKPEGALKEFKTWLVFEPLEGGLVVLKEMQMRGFAKALLGIVKVRFSGSIKYSNYQILDEIDSRKIE